MYLIRDRIMQADPTVEHSKSMVSIPKVLSTLIIPLEEQSASADPILLVST